MSFETYNRILSALQPHIYHVVLALIIVVWWAIVIKSVVMVVKGVFTGSPSKEGMKLYALQAAYGIVAREITKFLFQIISDLGYLHTIKGLMICLIIIRGLALIPLISLELKLNGINRITLSWRKRK